MNDKQSGRLLAGVVLIFMWFGGCTVIKDMTTEEVRNPYTGETERVQKPYLGWEKGVAKGLFLGLLGTTGYFLKEL